jgi:hypothetical protein
MRTDEHQMTPDDPFWKESAMDINAAYWLPYWFRVRAPSLPLGRIWHYFDRFWTGFAQI